MDREAIALASAMMVILSGVAFDYEVNGTAFALGIVATGLLLWSLFWEGAQ